MSTAAPSSHTPYDVIVIGAGINGLGIVRDAAERGLRVVLVEQEDLCFGVSAWSGRLVHGGLRYLEHGDVPLVRESLRERERLFRLAPHLVKPVRLIMPFYSRNKRPSWLIRVGMLAYDVLSFDKSVKWHRILSSSRVRERFTGMEPTGLSGAALFTDGQVEYAERLCVELAIAAAGAGAVIRLHERVTDLISEDG
jgi:glycerol-3-phosphate dehydrogenase